MNKITVDTLNDITMPAISLPKFHKLFFSLLEQQGLNSVQHFLFNNPTYKLDENEAKIYYGMGKITIFEMQIIIERLQKVFEQIPVKMVVYFDTRCVSISNNTHQLNLVIAIKEPVIYIEEKE